jgi:chromosome segregation ATPase
MNGMERHELGDRQLDAVLERLDRLCDEVHTLNRRLDSSDQLVRIARELSTLNESLQTLAYAALGRQTPTVRRRRTG